MESPGAAGGLGVKRLLHKRAGESGLRNDGEQQPSFTPAEVVLMVDEFFLECRSVADRTLVRVGGEVDLTNSASLQSALAEGRLVDVDLSQVSFMDSSGVRALLEAHRVLHYRDGALRVVGASRVVRRVLEISGAEQVLLIDSL